MLLYLLRHGSAEPRRADLDDAARELTDKGREQSRRVAALLRRLQQPELVLSSPLRRARQTAEEVVRALGSITLRELPALIPGSPIDELVRALAGAEARCLLAVGHEPLLSSLVGALAGPGLRLDLKKGGLVELELETKQPPRATLLGVIRPGYLRDGD